VLVWVKVFSEGTVEKPRLLLELYADSPLVYERVQCVQDVVSRIFSLNMPLRPFYDYVCGDSVMLQVVRRLCGFKFPTTPSVFEALVDAIVEQQISIKVARTIEERLAVMFGKSLSLADGELFFAFPSAEALAEAGVERIRCAGLSLRKAEYIHGAAQLIVKGDLDFTRLNDKCLEEAVSVLDAIRGVGVWSAELTLLRGMGWFNVLPADDFGIRRAISRYYCGGQSIKASEAREIAEAWGNWKGLAGFYLIIAEALNISL
jgi:DNA-3-methyladenine glycosylase II